jgi:DNA polymerase/3'-5' exonuclease PolX
MDDSVDSVYGIGEKNAAILKKTYNIRNVRELVRYAGKMPDIISDIQKEGLKYHERITGRVPRSEAAVHVKYILSRVRGAIACGSFRRGEPLIGDIDILTTLPIDTVVAGLQKDGYLVSTFVQGEEKYSGVGVIRGSYRKVDILHTTKDEMPFALLYFTGDFMQNILMRKQARRRKLVLSQHGLKHSTGHHYVKNIRSERDIFDHLGLEWKEPTERINEEKEEPPEIAVPARKRPGKQPSKKSAVD